VKHSRKAIRRAGLHVWETETVQATEGTGETRRMVFLRLFPASHTVAAFGGPRRWADAARWAAPARLGVVVRSVKDEIRRRERAASVPTNPPAMSEAEVLDWLEMEGVELKRTSLRRSLEGVR